MMRNRGTKRSLHLALGGTGIVFVSRVEHRDHGDGATAIASGPLALDQRALHRFPVLGRWFRSAYGLDGIAVAGVIVYGAEKLSEFLKIHAHLKHKLA